VALKSCPVCGCTECREVICGFSKPQEARRDHVGRHYQRNDGKPLEMLEIDGKHYVKGWDL
jgi:hypothetical protein